MFNTSIIYKTIINIILNSSLF